jgi:hypothetical protein
VRVWDETGQFLYLAQKDEKECSLGIKHCLNTELKKYVIEVKDKTGTKPGEQLLHVLTVPCNRTRHFECKLKSFSQGS